jgi:putative ABC transport system permease protein
MRLIDVFRLATRIFKNNRLRTFLTILGIGVGIGTIVFLVALGYGFQKLAVEKISRAEALLALDVQPSRGERSREITEDIKTRIEELSQVERVEPVLTVSGQALLNDAPGDLSIIYGVEEGYFSLEGVSFYLGTGFSSQDVDKIVVTKAVLDLFSLDYKQLPQEKLNLSYFVTSEEDGTTQQIADRQDYEIVGVVIDDDEQASVYLPYGVVREYFPGQPFSSIKVKVKSQEDIADVKDQISAMGFPVSATIDMVEQLEKGFKAFRFVLGLLGVIALVVASIGMFNTLTISLLERIKEVGIMKAIGAADRDIYSVFMAEAIMIGFLGGVVGLILGWTASYFVNTIFNMMAGAFEGEQVKLFSFPFWFVLAVLIFSCFVAFMTGIYPAKRAARLNPLQALRYE